MLMPTYSQFTSVTLLYLELGLAETVITRLPAFSFTLSQGYYLCAVGGFVGADFLLFFMFALPIIYNSISMYETVSLTSHERERMETEKQLYVLLKMINLTEKYYLAEKIDSSTYKTNIKNYIERYNRFSMAIPNYKFQDFLRKYNIEVEELSFAKLVLEKGIHSEENSSKEAFLYMQLTSKFIEANDNLSMNAEDPTIGAVKPPLEELAIILKKIAPKLGEDFLRKFGEYELMLKNYVTSRTVGQSLTQSELKQIQMCVQGMYRMTEIILKS